MLFLSVALSIEGVRLHREHRAPSSVDDRGEKKDEVTEVLLGLVQLEPSLTCSIFCTGCGCGRKSVGDCAARVCICKKLATSMLGFWGVIGVVCGVSY